MHIFTKIITSVLLSCFVATPAFAQTFKATASTFSDVQNHPSAYAIGYLQEKGVIGGYSDGTFKPNATINRAEFVKIIVLAYFNDGRLDLCDPNHIYNFTDASKTAWYAKTLCFAVQHHMVDGYGDGTFRPDATINLAEAAKIVSNVDILDISTAPTTTIHLPAGEPWYAGYMKYLDEHNAMPATLVSSPDHLLTRGEMAEIIFGLQYRYKATQRDFRRSSDVNSILNALRMYSIDSEGALPISLPEDPTEICAFSECTDSFVNLFELVSNYYFVQIPRDPNVISGMGTGYFISRDATNGRITITSRDAELRRISVQY